MKCAQAQDFLDTSNAEVTAVNRQLEQVQQRFDVGLVAITDVLESQAAYDNALVRKYRLMGSRYFFPNIRYINWKNIRVFGSRIRITSDHKP